MSGIPAALTQVFPAAQHQLCIWHIAKNIRLHVKRAEVATTAVECFGKLSAVTDEVEFEIQWKQLIDRLDDGERGYMQHIYFQRQKWSAVWTSRMRNLGIKSTQRAESLNSVVKSTIDRSVTMAELLEVFKSWTNRLEDTRKYLTIEQEWKRPTKEDMLLSVLEPHISAYALAILQQEAKSIGPVVVSEALDGSSIVDCADGTTGIKISDIEPSTCQ